MRLSAPGSLAGVPGVSERFRHHQQQNLESLLEYQAMSEICETCLRLVESVRLTRKELSVNWADWRAIFLRCEKYERFVLREASKNSWSPEILSIIQSISHLLEDVDALSLRYTTRVYYLGLTSRPCQQIYRDTVNGLRERISALDSNLRANDPSFETISLLQQDFMDAKETFYMLVNEALRELAEANENAQDDILQLRTDVIDFEEFYGKYTEPPLAEDVLAEFRSEMKQLADSLAGRLEAELPRASTRVDLVCKLVRYQALSVEAEKERKARLVELIVPKSKIHFAPSHQSLIQLGRFGELRVASLRQQRAMVKTWRAGGGSGSAIAGQHIKQEERRALEDEILLLYYLRNQSVLDVLGYYTDADEIVVALELPHFGSLDGVISNTSLQAQKLFSLSLQLQWLCDVTAALEFVHRKRIKHLNIRPSNIFVFAGLRLKLSGFGSNDNQYWSLNSSIDCRAGDMLRFMAPEIRNGEQAQFSSDIFAFAMTVVNLFTGRIPEFANCKGQLVSAVNQAVGAEIDRAQHSNDADRMLEWQRFSQALQDLLVSCVLYQGGVRILDALRPTAAYLFDALRKLSETISYVDPRAHSDSIQTIERELNSHMRTHVQGLPATTQQTVVELAFTPKPSVDNLSVIHSPANAKNNQGAPHVHAHALTPQTSDDSMTTANTINTPLKLASGMRELSTLSAEELLQLLKTLALPENIVKIIADNHIDGVGMCHVQSATEFEQLNIPAIHARKLFTIVLEARKVGVHDDRVRVGEHESATDDVMDDSTVQSVYSCGDDASTLPTVNSLGDASGASMHSQQSVGSNATVSAIFSGEYSSSENSCGPAETPQPVLGPTESIPALTTSSYVDAAAALGSGATSATVPPVHPMHAARAWMWTTYGHLERVVRGQEPLFAPQPPTNAATVTQEHQPLFPGSADADTHETDPVPPQSDLTGANMRTDGTTHLLLGPAETPDGSPEEQVSAVLWEEAAEHYRAALLCSASSRLWLESQSAHNVCARAYFMLFVFDGDSAGQHQDMQLAKLLVESNFITEFSADAADPVERMNALLFTGYYWYCGLGNVVDLRQAKYLLSASANLQLPEAQFRIGLLHFHAKEYADAIAWFTTATINLHPNAQYYLGMCFLDGHGTEVDRVLAIRWLTCAAEQGHAMGLYKLALCTPPLDPAVKYQWLEQSAAKGYAPAQYEFGMCIENGVGCAKNPTTAITWYEKAAKQGHSDAAKRLKTCVIS